jgi:16S rRNA (guanine527-N7)-methyltransferase
MPARASDIFGPRLADATAYVDLLAGAGVERGLIGPRERPRLWTRHVLNSAVIAALLPEDGSGRVVDVGSGAGLPGIPLALARPALSMTLLEPLARRVSFLDEVVATLRLDVEVLRARAEDVAVPRWDVVVARAVAPLERLLALADRLVHPGGMLLAIKGRTAGAEVKAATAEVRRRSTGPAEILTVGDEVAGATVVRITLDRPRSRRRGS